MRIRIKVRTSRKKAPRGSGWGSKQWLTVGTLAAYAGFGYGALPALHAQGGVPSPGQSAGQALAVLRFEVEAGPLEQVLAEYTKITGERVDLGNESIKKIHSPGVKGLYTGERALRLLLTNTGVSARLADGRILLELRGPNATVEVAERIQPTNPRYTEPLRDIPQTITIIPRAAMEEQGATTLRDVLRNIPGLTVSAGEGGNPAGDNITLRGFSARNDMFVDGVRDLSPQSRDPFNMEQVEVTKGPNSAIAGRGSTGGAINMVSKWPSLRKSFGGGMNFGSDGTRRFNGDVNIPLKERIAFRMNALSHHSGVAGRDVVENNRWGVAPSLAFGLGTPTRLTLGYYKLKQDNTSDYGIPWVPANSNILAAYRDQPAPVPRETFYGYRDRDHERMGSDSATVRFEHEFSDKMSIRNQLRYGRSTRDSIASPPRFASPDTTVINREMRSWITEDKIWDNQTDYKAVFSTGFIEHAFVGGANFTSEGNIRKSRSATNAPTTLFNPNPDDVYTGVITTSPIVGDITGKTQAFYAFDTAKFGQKFELTGGFRQERFATAGVNTSGVDTRRTDNMTSARAGAIYKPKQNGSIYFSYGSSMNPSLEGLSYNTATTALEPEKSYTLETGSKWDLLGERLSLSGALFQVKKTNARTPGLPDDPQMVLQGDQRVKGIELGIGGSITRAIKVTAAYTLLDSEITKSNTPAEVGMRFQNTPRNSMSSWATYTHRRFTIGGGIRFVGKRYGNNTNTRFVDDYWTLDGIASYTVNRHLDLRLNTFNLNDAYYFDRLGGGHVVPGPARSVNVTTNFRF